MLLDGERVVVPCQVGMTNHGAMQDLPKEDHEELMKAIRGARHHDPHFRVDHRIYRR